MANKGLQSYIDLAKEAKKLGGPQNLRMYYFKLGASAQQANIFKYIISLFKNNTQI